MKYLLVLLLINISISTSFCQRRLTEDEKIYVRSVRRIEKDKFIRAFKRKDGFLVVKFKKTKWVLKPSGFIEEIYELVDGKWVIQEREF